VLVVLAALFAEVKLRRHATACVEQSQELPLRTVVDVEVTGWRATPTGKLPRMDYQTIDPDRGVLYVAYPGNDEILIFDINQSKIVGHIPGLRQVHGALAVPSLRRLYASASGVDQVAIIDEESQRITARTSGGRYPDSIAYDPRDRKIFVSDSHATTDTVIDETTNRVVDTIDVGGAPGNSQYDSASGRVYTNVGTRNDLVAIDPKTDRLIARHPLPGCDHDHGLLLDAVRRLAFVACEGNARLIVLDMTTWEERSSYPVGVQPDILAFDGGLGRLYVASESGDVAVFEEKGRSLLPLGVGCLAREAHTVAVDPKTHRVYFALRNVGGRPVIRVMQPSKLNS
jgi:YVTN family beta-propeller protein